MGRVTRDGEDKVANEFEVEQESHSQTKGAFIMSGKNTAIFGIYPTYSSVDHGVQALKDAGFRNTDISVLFPQNVGSKDFAHEHDTKAPEGAATGAGTGAVVGGALDGWSASARWPFLASGLSSLPARSLQLSRAWEWGAQWAE